jgi:hypothetical protein
MKKRRYKWLVEALVRTARLNYSSGTAKVQYYLPTERTTLSTHNSVEKATAAMVGEQLTRDDLEWICVAKRRIRSPHRSKK